MKPIDICFTMELGMMFDDDKFYMNQLGRYKIVLTAEKIAEFVNYCENHDEAYFMEFEQILKNAEKTDDPCTLPKEKESK